MPTYLLQEDGFKFALEDSSGFILLEVQDTTSTTDLGNTMFGGRGEADYEEWKAQRRKKERDLESAQREAQETRQRLAQAESDLQRKAKARRESKARKAIQERTDRLARELEQAELQITTIMLEIERMEAEAQQFIALDRRRRLLLLTSVM